MDNVKVPIGSFAILPSVLRIGTETSIMMNHCGARMERLLAQFSADNKFGETENKSPNVINSSDFFIEVDFQQNIIIPKTESKTTLINTTNPTGCQGTKKLRIRGISE